MTSAHITAISAKGAAITGLSTSTFYYNRAPENARGLYAVWFGVNVIPDWDSIDEIIEDFFQVDFYTYGDPDNLLTAAANFRAGFHLGSITVTGYTTIDLRLISETPLDFEDDKVYRIIHEYRLLTQITR